MKKYSFMCAKWVYDQILYVFFLQSTNNCGNVEETELESKISMIFLSNKNQALLCDKKEINVPKIFGCLPISGMKVTYP